MWKTFYIKQRSFYKTGSEIYIFPLNNELFIIISGNLMLNYLKNEYQNSAQLHY